MLQTIIVVNCIVEMSFMSTYERRCGVKCNTEPQKQTDVTGLSVALSLPAPSDEVFIELLKLNIPNLRDSLIEVIKNSFSYGTIIAFLKVAVEHNFLKIDTKLAIALVKYNSLRDYMITVLSKEELANVCIELIKTGTKDGYVKELIYACGYNDELVKLTLNTECYFNLVIKRYPDVDLSKAGFKLLYNNISIPEVKRFLISKGLLDFAILCSFKETSPDKLRNLMQQYVAIPEWSGFQEQELRLFFSHGGLTDAITLLDNAGKRVIPTRELYNKLRIEKLTLGIVYKFFNFASEKEITTFANKVTVENLRQPLHKEFATKCFMKGYKLKQGVSVVFAAERVVLLQDLLPKELCVVIGSYML